MRLALVCVSFLFLTLSVATAQTGDGMIVAQAEVTVGTYETYFYGDDFNLQKYLVGDIDILPGGRYRFLKKTGTYSLTGGEVTWHDGPLQGVVTHYKTTGRKKPALVIPRAENRVRGVDMTVTADIWGYLR